MKALGITALLSCASFFAHSQTDIYQAARDGDVEAAQAMAVISADTLSATGPQGFTPAILAAYYDRADFLSYLITSGVDVSGEEGKPTALQGASFKGFEDCVEILLEADANPDFIDPSGFTALHYAAQFNHPEVVRLLVEHGADVSIPDASGRTALEIARMLSRTEIVEILEE